MQRRVNMLSCGERVVRCLRGDTVDHVPFGFGLGWNPWGQTMERWQKESGDPELNLAQRFGFDRSFVLPAIEYGSFPRFEKIVLEETADFIVSRDSDGVVRRQRRDRGSMPEFLEYPVKTPGDWERLKLERWQMSPARLRQDWDQLRRQLGETGEAVQVGVFPWGVFGTVRDLLGAEELLVSFYDEPAMVHDMMDHLTTLWITLWEHVARQVPIAHIHIWEDMSGRQGSLISPAMVEEFMMPCYDRIAAFARAHAVPLISVDTDGDCRQLVPVMMAHGVNMFFPFEVQAGNDILQYREQYPTLGIVGGLDKRALALGREEIDREVAKARAMVQRGRYIPAFDHLIPPDVPWDNYCYAAQQIKKACFS